MLSDATSYNPDLPNQPFELVVLEAALKEICQFYAHAEKQLDATINPACDALLKKVRAAVLYHMRFTAVLCLAPWIAHGVVKSDSASRALVKLIDSCAACRLASALRSTKECQAGQSRRRGNRSRGPGFCK